jgi:hypothetical protein
MAKHMKYRFTHILARLLVAMGITVIVASVAFSAVVFFVLPQSPGLSARLPHANEPFTRAAAAVVLFIVGLAVGSALIVVGQMMLAFLDMRATLRRIHRRLRKSGAFGDTESRVASRLRHRL